MSRHDQDTSRESPSVLARILLGAIGAYQRFLSPLLGSNCRFQPTCSAFTAEAITRHGALRGGFLGAWRICRCNPLCQGGYEPVPQTANLSFASQQKFND